MIKLNRPNRKGLVTMCVCQQCKPFSCVGKTPLALWLSCENGNTEIQIKEMVATKDQWQTINKESQQLIKDTKEGR